MFDVTVVGRTVTVVRNGVTTIDHKEIEGITGGALDAREEEPGPFLYPRRSHGERQVSQHHRFCPKIMRTAARRTNEGLQSALELSTKTIL